MKGTESECGVATARICGAVDYARTLAPPQGPGTHQAWLYGNIKRAVSKIFAAEGLRGGGNGLDFGVGGHVTECFGEIVATPYYAPFAHYHGSYGNLP